MYVWAWEGRDRQSERDRHRLGEGHLSGRGTSWSGNVSGCMGGKRPVSEPVFSLGGDAEFLDLALDGGEGFGSDGKVEKLGFGQLVEVLDGFRLRLGG